jgi:outer membrane protein assembly factor BamB
LEIMMCRAVTIVPLIRIAALGLVSLGLLAGCGLFDDKKTLAGERIHIRAQTAPSAPLEAAQAPLPDPRSNAEWTQTNGNASHNLGHLAGPGALISAWTRDAGSGGGDGAITGTPIVLNGVVFTMDAASTLTAFDASSGAERWRTELLPEAERGTEGFGGGLAAEGGTIYATTGFGEILAIRAASGEVLWRKSFGAPLRAAPAVLNGLVVAVTRDNRGLGLDAATGELRWRLRGATADAGLLGGASPAMVGPLAILPYASGELVAVDAPSGRRLWSAVLSGGRKGMARSAITDVSGDPVVIGPYVVAANQSGRMLAIDARNGQRVWTRNIGSPAPIWAAGETIFVISDDARLMRLSARDGTTLWEAQLPAFRNEKKRKNAIAYSGPVLVNGQLLFTDSRGNMLSYDAQSGVGRTVGSISGGSVTGPVVAGGTVYILSDEGTLHAFR